MPINDKSELIAELKGVCKNTELVPRTRIIAARRLLRETEHSTRSVKVAKHVAKLFMINMEIDADDRKSAQSLYEFAMGAKNERAEEDAEQPEKITAIVEPKSAIAGAYKLAVRTREEILATANEGWNDPIAPRKLLTFYESKDLLQYGIDLNSSETYHVDGSLVKGLASHVYNPRYATAFAAWKQKRFNGVTPDRWSTWRLFFEHDISSYPDCNPKEQPCGSVLLKREAQLGNIQGWEMDFLWDLYWDILKSNRDDFTVNTLPTPGFDWKRYRTTPTTAAGPEDVNRILDAFCEAEPIAAQNKIGFRDDVAPAPIRPVVLNPAASVPPSIGAGQSLPTTRINCPVCRSVDKGNEPPAHECAEEIRKEIENVNAN